MADHDEPKLLIEVFRNTSGIITVTTDYGVGGTRLCGVKLTASGSRKIAEFYLGKQEVEALVEDFAACKEAQP